MRNPLELCIWYNSIFKKALKGVHLHLMKIDFCLKKISFIYKFTFHSKIIERNFNFNLLVLSFIKFNCAAANPTALELLLLQVKWWILSNWQERNELPPLRKGCAGLRQLVWLRAVAKHGRGFQVYLLSWPGSRLSQNRCQQHTHSLQKQLPSKWNSHEKQQQQQQTI